MNEQDYQAHFETLPKEEQRERTEAYNKYVCKVYEYYHRYPLGEVPTPIAQHRWEWKPCYLCKKTIRDDPFGFNPFPLCDATDKESRVCGFCNQCFVVPNRLLISDAVVLDGRTLQEIRDDGRRYEESIRAMNIPEFKEKVEACEYWRSPRPRSEGEEYADDKVEIQK